MTNDHPNYDMTAPREPHIPPDPQVADSALHRLSYLNRTRVGVEASIFTKSIYVLTTHHADPNEAAEAWKKEGVCAVGWSDFGDLRRPKKSLRSEQQLFMEIEKGDLIFAYAKSNTIAYVGEVVSEFKRNIKNKVGMSEKSNGFGYPNQYEVNWRKAPKYFNRSQLPGELSDQIGLPHRTIVRLDLGNLRFDDILRWIKQSVRSGSALDPVEDLVKAGIRKYLRGPKINHLEEGLEITSAEEFTSEGEKPDFEAEDASRNVVLIECKGTAREQDCDQLERYRKKYPKRGKQIRSMLVAFRIEPRCKKTARSKGIELVECDLNFTKL